VSEAPATLRLDKWLWFARFCKTRAMAQKLIERGQATLNGAVVSKTAATVRAGDKLTVIIGPMRRSFMIRDVSDRRGSAPEARGLYEETAPPERIPDEDAALPLHQTPYGLMRR